MSSATEHWLTFNGPHGMIAQMIQLFISAYGFMLSEKNTPLPSFDCGVTINISVDIADRTVSSSHDDKQAATICTPPQCKIYSLFSISTKKEKKKKGDHCCCR